MKSAERRSKAFNASSGRRRKINLRGHEDPDFSEIKGQRSLRRAIEVACSGMHNLLMLCLFHPFRDSRF